MGCKEENGDPRTHKSRAPLRAGRPPNSTIELLRVPRLVPFKGAVFSYPFSISILFASLSFRLFPFFSSPPKPQSHTKLSVPPVLLLSLLCVNSFLSVHILPNNPVPPHPLPLYFSPHSTGTRYRLRWTACFEYEYRSGVTADSTTPAPLSLFRSSLAHPFPTRRLPEISAIRSPVPTGTK